MSPVRPRLLIVSAVQRNLLLCSNYLPLLNLSFVVIKM